MLPPERSYRGVAALLLNPGSPASNLGRPSCTHIHSPTKVGLFNHTIRAKTSTSDYHVPVRTIGVGRSLVVATGPQRFQVSNGSGDNSIFLVPCADWQDF